MGIREVSHIIDNLGEFQLKDRESLTYTVLFSALGVKPNNALTIIPFLNRDRHYLPIPGKLLRINDFGGGLRKITDPSTLEEELSSYQETLPEIPLVPLDLRHGIPQSFSRKYGRADLFVVNHGIILSHLDSQDPEAGARYLASIENATHSGSLLMIIDNPDDWSADEMGEAIGSKPFNDVVHERASQYLQQHGLQRRRLSREHEDGMEHLGDYIQLPETHEHDRLVFFTKT